MLQLDSLAASFLVMSIGVTSFKRSALPANDDLLHIVIDLLLRLERVKALSHLASRVLE